MQRPNLKILQRFRLRPKPKGKLPNFTKDFQSYTDRINQLIKDKVQWSFQLNKFGGQKKRKNSNNNPIKTMPQRVFNTEIHDQNNDQNLKLQKSCLRLLKYNQTKIKPTHKIKITQKKSKKHNKQNLQSLIVLQPIKFSRLNEISSKQCKNRLPKINFTNRQVQQIFPVLIQQNKSNRILKQNLTGRAYHYEPLLRNKCYNKIFHIVTMGRKEIAQQRG